GIARRTGEDESGEEHRYDAVEQPPTPAREWPKPEGSEDAHDALEEEHPGEDQRHRNECRPGLPQQVETDPHIERAEEHLPEAIVAPALGPGPPAAPPRPHPPP